MAHTVNLVRTYTALRPDGTLVGHRVYARYAPRWRDDDMLYVAWPERPGAPRAARAGWWGLCWIAHPLNTLEDARVERAIAASRLGREKE